jgi:hypothetical protein
VTPRRDPAVPGRSTLYGSWVVAVLTLVLVFSFLDRSILALLVEPIKTEGIGGAGSRGASRATLK